MYDPFAEDVVVPEFTEILVSITKKSIDKYNETYVPKEEVEKVKKILRSEGEQVLSKSRFRKALRS